ncbi:MAG TPA: HEAT repeat domain-containing protein [Pirellulaceae bacterium]|nr:HEAT repeat domain-containing protein [Pirellulaceae bacterium]
MHRVLAASLACLPLVAAGCADGPVPELRTLNPWVRRQWDADERAIATYHRKVADLAALRAQAARLPAEQAEPLAAQLAAGLQAETAPVLRAELARTLGELPTPAARSALQAALTDEAPNVRIAACQALARHPAPEAVEPLAHAVSADADLDVRIAAADALGKFAAAGLPAEEYKRLAQSLRPALDDRDPALQTAAMQSLAAITGRDNFRNDLNTWRQYLDGANPAPPPPPTVAELVQRSLNWY